MADIAYTIKVDWDDSGAFDGTGEDITARVLELRWSRGRDDESQLTGRSIAGACAILVNNASGDYSRFNSASPLFGNLLPGRAIRIHAASQAAQFVAANSEYLSIADNASLSTGDIDFTWAGWVRLDSVAATMQIATKGYLVLGLREWSLLFSQGFGTFMLQVDTDGSSNTNLVDTDLGTAVVGTWYFIAVWHDATANTINIQINNGTTTSAAYAGGLTDLAGAYQMGARIGGTSFFDGRQAAAMFTKEVLTSAERTWLYNGGNGRTYQDLGRPGDGSDLLANLEAFWELDEESGTRFDSHGSNDLTDNNTVLATEGIANRPLWTGKLLRVEPAISINPGQFAWIIGIGAFGVINERIVNLAVQTSIGTGALWDAILDEIGWPAGERSTDTGQTTINRYWSDGIRGLSALRQVEMTEGGFGLEAKNGDIDFQGRHHRLTGDSLVSQATFSDAIGAALSYRAIKEADPLPGLFNIFSAPVQLYTVGNLATLWTLAEVGAATAGIPPGQSFTWWAAYPNPASATNAVHVNAWTDPAASTDWNFNSVAGGGGSDLNGDMSLVISKFAKRMKLVFTNGGVTDTAFVQDMKARGTPVTADDPIIIQAEDDTSKTTFGERTWPTPPRFLPDTAEAQNWADFHVGIYANPIPKLAMTVIANRDSAHREQVLTRDVGDRITVVADNDANLGLTKDFFIEWERHIVTMAGKLHTVTWGLSGAEEFSDFWVLDTSELDTQTRLAY